MILGRTGIGVNYKNQLDKLMETKVGEDREPNKKNKHKYKKVNVEEMYLEWTKTKCKTKKKTEVK